MEVKKIISEKSIEDPYHLGYFKIRDRYTVMLFIFICIST